MGKCRKTFMPIKRRVKSKKKLKKNQKYLKSPKNRSQFIIKEYKKNFEMHDDDNFLCCGSMIGYTDDDCFSSISTELEL